MCEKLKVTLPDYYGEFKCIGGRCEDSCCIGWDIDIDKNTYMDYKELKELEFENLFKDNMYINSECVNEDVDYGRINLNEEKRCPFLNQCNYCRIHSEIGEEYLSNTCSHFPRVLNKVDEEFEISLDLACPEAAEIILNKEEGIKLKKEDLTLKKYIIAGEINSKDEDFEDYPAKNFREIRDFCVEIIQNRNLSLSKRLYVLGEFLFNLEEKSYNSYEYAKNFIENYSVEKSAECYKRDDLNYMMQISFFENIVKSLNIYEETDSELFRKCTEEVLKGFNIKSKEQLEEESDKYIDLFADYSRDYIDTNEYIFENYIVNFIYNNLFPYSESDSIFEGYMMLLIRYSLMRFYLVGRYSYRGYESRDEIIRFIHIFSKAVEHDKNYIEEILDYIIENEFDNFDFAKMIM